MQYEVQSLSQFIRTQMFFRWFFVEGAMGDAITKSRIPR